MRREKRERRLAGGTLITALSEICTPRHRLRGPAWLAKKPSTTAFASPNCVRFCFLLAERPRVNAVALMRKGKTYARSYIWCALFGLLAAGVVLLAAAAVAQTVDAGVDQDSRKTPTRTLRVGAAGSEPFVISTGDRLSGLSVDVWREVARGAELDYELSHFETVDAALAALSTGALDTVIGPVSITSVRERRVRFTQPYFQSSLGILAPAQSGVAERLAPFLTKAFLFGAVTLLLILSFVGTLFWLTERRKNTEMFPKNAFRGVGNGIWLALVTMTTVGYGDRVPITAWGRVVAGVWMVIAMLTVSSLTAGIATALTVSQLKSPEIQSIEQLRGRRVGALEGTSSARFARESGVRLIEVRDLDEAVDGLSTGHVAAIVHDRPILEYYLSEHPEFDATLAKARYQPQGYGFAVRRDRSELQQRISISLLEQAENRTIQRIIRRWLGSDGN